MTNTIETVKFLEAEKNSNFLMGVQETTSWQASWTDIRKNNIPRLTLILLLVSFNQAAKYDDVQKKFLHEDVCYYYWKVCLFW